MSPKAAIPGESEVIHEIQELAGHIPVYLVGGAIRDRLLGLPRRDLDFALQEDEVRSLARKVANEFKGSFYILDDKRNTARVILGRNGQRMLLDFAGFRGGDIESDLFGRDFTINSMAMEVHEPEKMIDPLHGARDLMEKTLRPCGPSSFLDDPVRAMRAVRMSVSFGLRMDKATSDLLRQVVDKLGGVSIERRRDELFHMLESSRPAASIWLLNHFQLLPCILPELQASLGIFRDQPDQKSMYGHSLAVVGFLESLYSVLVKPYREETASSNLVMGNAVLHLGRFRENLAHHFDQHLVTDRSRLGLLMLAGLYNRIGDVSSKLPGEVDGNLEIRGNKNCSRIASDRARALALSRSEIEMVRTIIAHYSEVHALAKRTGNPSRRDVFLYFHDVDQYGVDACILALADLLATYQSTIPQDIWLNELTSVRALLEGWFDRRSEVVNPVPLIDGNDLMERFLLGPGPLVGKALDTLREAQACGEVTSRAEALAYLEKWYTTGRDKILGTGE